MKVHVLSDLHLEFSDFVPPPNIADVVILAGDIHTKCRGVEWANETFRCEVIYVCGNHEFYGGHIDHTLRKMRDAAAPHIHVLENQVWIHDEIRFLVTTGWTDFSSTGDVMAATLICGQLMNDFKMIGTEDSYRRLRPADVVELNRAAFEFLENELCKPFEGKTVVVTHHCPVAELAGEENDGHLSAAFFNRWQSLLPLANVWIYGHTHRAVDIELGGCRVISNPRGYPGEETGFAPNLTVEI
ncbi:metallophosphoesterase family protein [Pseudomonas mandelii]|uniref:metallophosphoesterase family protein n=1 Tax=Pseudomonas mandelii TaxID=75612 RepID=UPI00047769CB|nr:metallophosphoesterase family protein [Pseudomonas mandelii]